MAVTSDGLARFKGHSDKNQQWLNGLITTRQILSEYADAKIVIITNYNDEHFRKFAREAGAANYVLKENLLDIRRILQQI